MILGKVKKARTELTGIVVCADKIRKNGKKPAGAPCTSPGQCESGKCEWDQTGMQSCKATTVCTKHAHDDDTDAAWSYSIGLVNCTNLQKNYVL